MTSETLLEKELDELYAKVAHGERRGVRVGLVRRVLAYGLKGVAAGGSLVVATGQFTPAHQGIGIAVLVAVFLDGLSSNHDRLIAEVEAGYAYKAIRHRVKTTYNRKVAPYLKKLSQAGNATDAEAAVERLQQTAAKDLADAIADIEGLRAKADIKALRRLSLEEERAAAHGS